MSIEVTRDVFRLAQAFTISRGSRTEAQVIRVRITRDGVTGQGFSTWAYDGLRRQMTRGT